MKRAALYLMSVLLLCQLQAAELNWLTDLDKAKAEAKTANKAILINFTGSDWCGFCKKLHKEVFVTDEFADYAKKNLVLVEIDFPRAKPLPEAQQKANDKLKGEFKVRGFPTLVVLDSSGKKLGEEVGYGGGGPKAVLGKLDTLRGK
jgi:protein disulfide-isomerase